MQIPIPYGTTTAHAEIPIERLLTLDRSGPPLPPVDAHDAVRAALENPVRYPPLRQALTPDDHLTVVVDERIPDLARILEVTLDHCGGAGVAPESVTLLCPPGGGTQPWINDLPERFESDHVEVHDPTDRRRLSYLATTRDGRRIYLNRAAVEADQLVVLSGLHYDSLHGYAGPPSLIYPALGDVEGRSAWQKALTTAAPSDEPWPVRREAEEVLWLLGAPFLVQVVPGAGNDVVQAIAGSLDSLPDGRNALDAMWRSTVARRADIVIAGIRGSGQTIGDWAQALAAASRVVADPGTIALMADGAPGLGDAMARASGFDEAATALKSLQKNPPADISIAYDWLRACIHSRVILHSGISDDQAESLFVTPLADARQLQRVLDAGGDCLVIPDAHRAMVTVAGE